MLFAIMAFDKEGAIELRKANRPDHLAYLEEHKDKIYVAGAMLTDEAGTSMKGSLLIIDAENLAEVESFCKNDPYNKAGLFAKVEITPYRKAMGK